MLNETLPFKNPNFKIIYKSAHLTNSNSVLPHWHEALELLYIQEGQLRVLCNGEEKVYSPNEIVVFNSNAIHSINVYEESAVYYFLIIDLSICNIGKLPLSSSNQEIVSLFQGIQKELSSKNRNYQEATIGYIKLMLSLLSREYSENNSAEIANQKSKYVKLAIDYMTKHFQENICLDDICKATHLNKYYLSHIFKEVAGQPLMSHLNTIRCNHARTMLMSGKYSVSESAYASGFTNLSHFSQTYKKLFNGSPSNELKRYQM
jgi:YesN/AraC family two-component response regulator